jgi:hypothetical protein
MKKFLLVSLLSMIACLVFSSQSSAQETTGDKISLKIIRDGKIVTDTSFQLKEGQDPEAVKKVISHVLDGDIQVISGKEGHQKMVWVTSEDDKHMWHAEEIEIEMDSIMKHEEKVMVFEGEPGEHHHKVVVRKKSPGGETVWVSSGDELEICEEEGEGSKIIIITKKGDRDPEVKKVKVIVEGDDDVEIMEDEDLDWIEGEDFEWIEEKNADHLDVYIIKEDDGTKIIKKMRVKEEEEEDDNDVTTEPAQAPPAKAGKKKK